MSLIEVTLTPQERPTSCDSIYTRSSYGMKPAPLSFLFAPSVDKTSYRSPSSFPRTPSTADPLADKLNTSSLPSDDVSPATPKDSSPPMTASSPNGSFHFRGGVAPPPSPLVAFVLSPRLPRSLADIDQRYLYEALVARLQQRVPTLTVGEKVARWQQAGLPSSVAEEEELR